MSKYLFILIGIAVLAIVALAIVGTWNFAKDNPVREAQAQATAAVIYRQMTPSVTATPTPNGTPTPNLAVIALTAAAQEQAAQLQAEREKRAAELEKAKLNQEVELAKIAAEQEALKLSFTATAAYDATQFALAMQATQTQTVKDNIAGTKTATAVYAADVLTQIAIPVVQTVEWANAVKVSNAAEVYKASIYTKTFTPTFIIIILSFAVIFALFKWLEVRTISRDESQRNKTLTIHHKKGTTVANQDRIPGGLFTVSKDGTVIIHQADREEQSRTVERAQWVDGLQALPPGREREAGRIMNNILGRSSQPQRFSLLGDGSLKSVLHEADDLMMEEDA
jgi:flagellar basal body-associated protein FliL